MNQDDIANWLAERSTDAADVLVEAATRYSFMLTMVPDEPVPDQRLVDAVHDLQGAAREYLALCDLLQAAKGTDHPLNGNGSYLA